MAAAILFCVFLAILFFVAAWISWPKEDAVHINDVGSEYFTIIPNNGRYHILDAETYKVLGRFAEESIRDSAFFYQRQYTYYSVIVTDKRGQQFIMAVRTDGKSQQLECGNCVLLYGMISELSADRSRELMEQLGEYDIPVVNWCLNDNDDSIAGRYAKSVFFGFAFAAILGLVGIIIWKNAK